MSASTPDRPPRTRLPLAAAAVVLARSRFLLLVGGMLGITAVWPFLRIGWDKLTRSAPTGGAISSDTEYWCPMCPGVVSEWPAKCPVCSMALVRRKKGEMTPLPDGVVARVQLSPYRLQLAGIQTSPVEYRRLEYEITAAGLLEAPAGGGSAAALTLAADVLDPDAVLLAVGQEGQAACDLWPGESFPARVVEITPASTPAAGRRVRVRVENPRGDLRPGGYAAAKFLTPAAKLDAAHRHELEFWRDRVAVAQAFGPAGQPEVLFSALIEIGVRQAAARSGWTLCVPEAAVIDTGTRRVVYLESMPGMFDAVEVWLGRRCGDFYPVRDGVEAGQRVATAGAVLLDAETRLNPGVAAGYFGAGTARTPPPPPPAAPVSPQPDDRQLAARQKVCPVTEKPLDSMGGPVKVDLGGRVVFICCKGCEGRLRKNAAEYLSKLPK